MAESNPIRKKNLDLLSRLLFEKEKATKAIMAKETGISTVTVNSLVKELVEKKVFLEGEIIQSKLGRPAVGYNFNYDLKNFLLLSFQDDKGSLKIIVKIINLAGKEKAGRVIDFSTISLNRCKDILQKLLTIYEDMGLSGIGISIPGKIHDGIVLSSWKETMDGWELEKTLGEVTSLPIQIQNDAHLMTIGECIHRKLDKDQTIVGIFYPQKGMPGITIYANGRLLEGNNSLAGEAKYLPSLIDTPLPHNDVELAKRLADILSIYNVVVAPACFLLFSDDVPAEILEVAIENNPIYKRQPNKPLVLFGRDFQRSIFKGLNWLVTKDTVFEI